MQALSARTPSYFTNKSLQAYQHTTAAGESSLSSISSSPQLSVFSVAPECHPDHRNSPLDIQIPALSFSPSRACCLFLAPQTTSHPSACFLHFLLICHFSLLFHSPLQTSSLVTSSRAPYSTVLSSVEFSAVHNSLLHKSSSLNTACSSSASVPHLPLPYPELLRSLMVSKTPLIFS